MRVCCLLFLCWFAVPVLAQEEKADTFEALEAAKVLFDEAYRSGDIDAALEIADASVQVAEAAYGENAVVSLELRLKFAQAAAHKFGMLEALVHFRDAHARWAAHYPEAHPGRMLSQIELARALSITGQMEEALPLAVKAVRFAEQVFGEGEEVTHVWRATLAGIYYELGYLAETIAAHKIIIAFFDTSDGELARRRAGVYSYTLAQIYEDTGQTESAAPYWRRSVERLRSSFGLQHTQTLEAELNRLIHFYRMGQYDALDEAIIDLFPRVTEIFGPDSPHMYLLRERRALFQATISEKGSPGFLKAAKDMRAVAQYYEQALGQNADRTGRAWLDLSPMLTDAGDHAGALEAALNAEAAGVNSRDTLYFTLWTAVEEGVLSAEDGAKEAFRIAQLTHNGKFKAAAQSQGLRLEFGTGDLGKAYRELTDLQSFEQEMQAQLAGMVNLPKGDRDPALEREMQSKLAINSAEIGRLSRYLKDNEPAGAAMLGDAELSVDEAQRLLLPHEALVVFDLAEDDSGNHFMVAVTKERVVWRLTGSNLQNMSLAAADAREGIDLRFGLRAAESLDEDSSQGDDMTFHFGASEYLYDTTFGELEDVIGEKTHWFVDLRGPLSGLPPQLLIKRPLSEETTWQTIHWLVRDHAITVIPSAFALKVTELARAAPPDRKALLAFADPDFGEKPTDTIQVASLSAGEGALRGALAPLPETRDEVRAVARALNHEGTALFEGTSASEAELKKQTLAEYEILYFATHGLVAGDMVRDGELAEPALALTAGGGEDGLLTQSEVAELKLNADLVVLSACNTAVGGTPGAEALSGLAQAFSYAGARALLVSHWPVESQSAVALMTDMFARRAQDENLTMAEAQRQAILEILDNAPRPEWVHPAYWAPFVLVGTPD